MVRYGGQATIFTGASSLAAPKCARFRPTQDRDGTVKTPIAVFQHKLVDRADAIRRADPHVDSFAPRFEVFIDVTWKAVQPAFGGERQGMGLQVSGRTECPGCVKPGGVRQIGPIGNREDRGTGPHCSADGLSCDDLKR